jgi:hypothetical protein
MATAGTTTQAPAVSAELRAAVERAPVASPPLRGRSGRYPPTLRLPSGSFGHGREHPVRLLVRRSAQR